MIVLSALEFGNEVASGDSVGNDGVLEPANLCLKCIAAVEKDNIIAAFGN